MIFVNVMCDATYSTLPVDCPLQFCDVLVDCALWHNVFYINPLNAELNPICYLLALLGAHHFLHVSRIRVKSLTLRQLMSYIYIYIYIWSTHS